tara:strand:- start:693 stop:1103 length:411 start_codon:yes stop_codon:yes gene_type:complete
MNNYEAFTILNESWTKEKLLEKVKKGRSSDQIVREFIGENKKSLNTVINLIKKEDRDFLNHMETLNNCEIKLINHLKIKDTLSNNSNIEKADEQNPISKIYKEFNLSLFLNKWSNQFVIGTLIMISLMSLTKQAWA